METKRPGEYFGGESVAVVGLGKSNQALCRYLAKHGADLTCFDRKGKEELGDAYRQLASLGVKWSLGKDYLGPLPSFRRIFLTPGIKKDLPEIVQAKVNGARVSGEIPLFLERCGAKVAGVTGSAGKTTVTTLAGLMLRASDLGVPLYMGGNIGSVLIEQVDDILPESLVVLELSSFQLENVTTSPQVAVILNVRPNHLDIHDSYEEYVAAKANIFRHQGQNDWCVVNLDDPVTVRFGQICPGNMAGFTLDAKKAEGSIASGLKAVAWLDGKTLKIQSPGLSERDDAWAAPIAMVERKDLLVPGLHNVSNALGAALLAALMGGSPSGIRSGIRSFRGVEHRIEFVREKDGVRYYNDSIATSPDRTEALLDAVSGPLVLILGGYDKGLPFDDLAGRVVDRGCAVVTMGDTAPLLEKALRAAYETKKPSYPVDVTRASSLPKAVQIASQKARPGWSVALSPACASYDMFRDFEERGRLFKETVANLSD